MALKGEEEKSIGRCQHQNRKDCDDRQAAGGAFERTAKDQPVPGWEIERRIERFPCGFHRTRQVSAFDIGCQHRHPAHAFPADDARAQILAYPCHASEPDHLASLGQHGHLLQFLPMTVPVATETHHYRGRQPFLQNLADPGSLKQRFNGPGESAGIQSVSRHRLPVERNDQLRNRSLLLIGEIDDPGYAPKSLFRSRSEAPEHCQIGAEDLDRQVGLGARDHVFDAMADRLTKGHVHARDGGDGATHLLKQLFLRSTGPQNYLDL